MSQLKDYCHRCKVAVFQTRPLLERSETCFVVGISVHKKVPLRSGVVHSIYNSLYWLGMELCVNSSTVDTKT